MTRSRFHASYFVVSRLRRLIALVLLAFWLPATLHCALEEAGLEIAFVCHDHDGDHAHHHAPPAHTGAHCDDACHTLEGAAIKTVSAVKLVGQPTPFLIARLPDPPEIPADHVCPERTDAPGELGRAWQFSTRAAPPARAPSASV